MKNEALTIIKSNEFNESKKNDFENEPSTNELLKLESNMNEVKFVDNCSKAIKKTSKSKKAKNNINVYKDIQNDIANSIEYEDIDALDDNSILNDTDMDDDVNDDTSGAYIDILQAYVKDIGKYELLTSYEELELAKQIKAGDLQAKQKLINSNLRLSYAIAYNYYYAYFRNSVCLQLLDVIQDANLGLIKAVERFDYTLGYRFTTYAYWWIKQSVLRHAHDSGYCIKLPHRVSEQVSLFNKARAQLAANGNQMPSLKELSDFINANPKYRHYNIKKVTPEMIWEFETAYDNSIVVSLNAPIKDSEDMTIGDFIPSNDEYNPENIIDNQLYAEHINKLLDEILKPKIALVMKLRFGIGTYNNMPMKLAEVGCLIGTTRERVRQIQDKGLRILKNHFTRLQRKTGKPMDELI